MKRQHEKDSFSRLKEILHSFSRPLDFTIEIEKCSSTRATLVKKYAMYDTQKTPKWMKDGVFETIVFTFKGKGAKFKSSAVFSVQTNPTVLRILSHGGSRSICRYSSLFTGLFLLIIGARQAEMKSVYLLAPIEASKTYLK